MISELENTARLVLGDLNSKETTKTKVSYLYLFIKRTFDICASFFGLIFLLPVILGVKIAYMLHGDFNKVIYTQVFDNHNNLNPKILREVLAHILHIMSY